MTKLSLTQECCVRLTCSQDSVVNAVHFSSSGHGKPNLFISGSQPDFAFSQRVLQGGRGFPDTHSGTKIEHNSGFKWEEHSTLTSG